MEGEVDLNRTKFAGIFCLGAGIVVLLSSLVFGTFNITGESWVIGEALIDYHSMQQLQDQELCAPYYYDVQVGLTRFLEASEAEELKNDYETNWLNKYVDGLKLVWCRYQGQTSPFILMQVKADSTVDMTGWDFEQKLIDEGIPLAGMRVNYIYEFVEPSTSDPVNQEDSFEQDDPENPFNQDEPEESVDQETPDPSEEIPFLENPRINHISVEQSAIGIAGIVAGICLLVYDKYFK